jgi:hypothetical protein
MIHPAAEAFRFSVGAFGGLNFPVAQEDTRSGSVFGIKGHIPVSTFLAIEPNFQSIKNGDASYDVQYVDNGPITAMTHEGGKFTSFGIDVTIGSVMGYKGFGACGILGISSAKFAKKGIPDLSKGSYWLGVGFGYGFTDQISLDVRAKALFFPYKDEIKNKDTGSRKNGLITVGLNYFFDIGEK